MLKMTGTACINASPEATWKILSDVESISQWSEPVLTAICTTDRKRGVGTERQCQLRNNLTVVERWVDWQEGESYTYEGFNLPLVKSARNTWSIRNENGKTLLKTESEVILKGGVFGRLLEPLMKLVANRMGADAMAAFAYLVENGRPYAGKHADLPRAPMIC